MRWAPSTLSENLLCEYKEGDSLLNMLLTVLDVVYISDKTFTHYDRKLANLHIDKTSHLVAEKCS